MKNKLFKSPHSNADREKARALFADVFDLTGVNVSVTGTTGNDMSFWLVMDGKDYDHAKWDGNPALLVGQLDSGRVVGHLVPDFAALVPELEPGANGIPQAKMRAIVAKLGGQTRVVPV